MAMTKTGAIDPRVTPDVEKHLADGEKQADLHTQIEALDDDPMKRLSDAAKKPRS